ncbi:hypothetical protein [Klebsiella sp. BIGb0407]|uniref:hypothetical protein n=1 Tax=Klebsiella sp. BIGb0407 TaxID=2940603 RepID=UPI002168670A|nr:hypothetical protein [Klebsiella sp. BIGb0407]MCS3431458.1 hypothetical protein [Klebsiella sp. BIGb0407]
MQNQHVLIQNMQKDDFFVGLELLKSCFHLTANNEQYDTLKTHFNSEVRYGDFTVSDNTAEYPPEVGNQRDINPLFIGVSVPMILQVAWVLLS